MRYFVLATDYDGTLATDGRVDSETLAALKRVKESGRKVVLVTGRELDELCEVFPEVDLCDWVVAENGALLYHPETREEKPLSERPPEKFIQALDARGVAPYSVGRVIVATWHPHETTVLELIRDFGLELQVIFNKGAVMILPSGTNKATGLKAALREMKISPHNAVGVGDAENDHALLSFCECGVAVENALPMLKERADLVTASDHGAGVQELIDNLIEDDLAQLEPRLTRHHILIGTDEDNREVRLPHAQANVLVAGTSGGGKSSLASGFLERLAENRYQFCVIDPEGDYENFETTVSVGTTQQAPVMEEVLSLLENPAGNAIVNMTGVPIHDRPQYFLTLLTRIQELRARSGHPHWIIVDEAHHVLPANWEPTTVAFPQALDRIFLVTLEPRMLAPAALASVDIVVAVGDKPQQIITDFCQAVGEKAPRLAHDKLEHGQVVVWRRRTGENPFLMHVAPGHTVRRRHDRKYATGELEPDRSFYFRGPEGKLNLRAQNLILFLQVAEGVDDETWDYHLHEGHYSRWFRECIKDEGLGDAAQAVEAERDLSPQESRARIKALIDERYTLPATPAPAADHG